MAALEKIGIVYADLKPDNILLKYTIVKGKGESKI